MSDDIHADEAVLDGIRDEFRHVSTELGNVKDPVAAQAAHVTSGAGEFADALADGLVTFQLSWGAALDATSETAGNIAANVGHFKIDLQAVDRASS
jgi:hypothetical protein